MFKKPPLGIVPRKIWLEKRLEDIHKASQRYYNAGKMIPVEWEKEAFNLLKEIKKCK